MTLPMTFTHRRLSVRAHLFVPVLSVYLPTVGIFTWHVLQELHAARKHASDSVKQLDSGSAESTLAIRLVIGL